MIRSLLDKSIGEAVLRSGYLTRLSAWVREAMPGYCAFCHLPAAPGLPWCNACFADLPWNLQGCHGCAEPFTLTLYCSHCQLARPAFARVYAGLVYEPPVSLLIHDFKFHASARAGHLLAELMGHTPLEVLPAALVPVPSSPVRAKERGFNQAEWLAHELGRRWQVPVTRGKRLRQGKLQHSLSRRERLTNLKGAFTFDTPLPAHIAIVDDVMTTGATAHALAEAALAAGAKQIDVWAAARTPGKDIDR